MKEKSKSLKGSKADDSDKQASMLSERVTILEDKLNRVYAGFNSLTSLANARGTVVEPGSYSGFEEGCSGCEDSCARGCEGGCQIKGCLLETSWGCSGETVVNPLDWWKLVTGSDISAILHGTNQIISGEPVESRARIELNMVILPPNSDISIETKDGNSEKAKSISSSLMRLYSPAEAFLKISDARGKEKIIGGKLIMAEGNYKKGTGIIIPEGSDATIMFKGTAYSGKIEEEITIGMNMIGINPGSAGISRITK